MKTVVLAILFSALTTPVKAQWLDHTAPGIPRTADGKPNLTAPAPHTADGKPDLTGLWNKISPKYGANIAADLKPGDIQPSTQALVDQRVENIGRDYMAAWCLPLGPGYSTSQAYMRILQTPDRIVMLNEDLTYRQIHMDGRALEADPQPNWMGYSVGHWEGDALVVDSFGFNDRTWLDMMGHPHTAALRMQERYRRRDFGHLDVEVTLKDPAVYAKPWTVSISALLAPDTELIENVCAENNKSLDHWVGKASDDLKSEIKVAPGILAKYVGTYVEQSPLWRTAPRTLAITFSDGALFGDLDGRGNVQLRAQSEIYFVGIQGGIEFVKKGEGEPPDLLVKHVSGSYRFARTK
jgi:hypothetical protein